MRPQRIALTNELPGRVKAFRTAQIRPQVSGIIQSRLFKEGSFVEKGQQLYQIDPVEMNNYNITALDVISAIREQNMQLATGEIGGAPSVEGQQINATITVQSLLETPEEFEQILLRVEADGSGVTIGDVARIEIGAESYRVIGRYSRKPAAGIAIHLAPGANALETLEAVKARVEEFRPIFPPGVETAFPVDISPFIRTSIFEVVKTLGMAIGAIYRQFAITISAAMGISLFIALSLSPALCAIVLTPGKRRKRKGPFGLFNRGYEKLEEGHGRLLKTLLKSRIILPFVFLLLLALSGLLFFRIPTGFLPREDQGRIFVLISGPPSSTLQLTLEKIKQVEDFFLDEIGDAVSGLFTAAGFSFSGSGQNVGIGFVALKDWEKRGEESSVFKLQQKAMQRLSAIPDAMIIPIVPPPVSALGNAGRVDQYHRHIGPHCYICQSIQTCPHL